MTGLQLLGWFTLGTAWGVIAFGLWATFTGWHD